MLDRPNATNDATGNGAERVGPVRVDTYNAELRDEEGFIGDRASGRAFRAILDDVRDQASNNADDPMGDTASEDIGKHMLDRILRDGNAEAAGVLIGTIEEFSQEFAAVIRRFLRLSDWHDTPRIVVGGGLRSSRIGEIAIGRTGVILRTAGQPIELKAIRNDPDKAGLIGCAHLAPDDVTAGHDAILAIDIGGSNIRVGIVSIASGLAEAEVVASDVWKHVADEPDRNGAVARIVDMLDAAIARAQEQGAKLASFIGVGCPGLIRDDGSIAKGGQNLPGDWEHPGFNLPRLLQEAIPSIAGRKTLVRMHNDAVLQGLSEAPFMSDVARWGVMTIGTGLGNARFTNRDSNEAKML